MSALPEREQTSAANLVSAADETNGSSRSESAPDYCRVNVSRYAYIPCGLLVTENGCPLHRRSK